MVSGGVVVNGEAPAILSINYHSKDGDRERYAVTLNHPDLPAPLGPPLQEVLAGDRQSIDDRVRWLIDQFSLTEWLEDTDRLEELVRKRQSLGRLLCTVFIPPGISEALKGSRAPLVISTELNNLPWELLHLGDDDFLGLKVPLVRNPLVETYKPGAIDELRRERRQPIHALLACNPGQPPLPMVREELEVLRRLLEGTQVAVRVMGQEPPDRLEFLGGLADRQFALVHFAGHGHYDVENPARSFIKVLDAGNVEQPVTAEQLRQHMAGAPLFFVNACESARESSIVGDELYLAERTKGFASLVISGGAIAFVGAQWPVQDLSAALFGAAFYQKLLDGAPVGEAVLFARQTCANGDLSEDLRALFPTGISPNARISQVTWANFVLYGQPLRRFV
jgi:CHAT domain-containing protein